MEGAGACACPFHQHRRLIHARIHLLRNFPILPRGSAWNRQARGTGAIIPTSAAPPDSHKLRGLQEMFSPSTSFVFTASAGLHAAWRPLTPFRTAHGLDSQWKRFLIDEIEQRFHLPSCCRSTFDQFGAHTTIFAYRIDEGSDPGSAR